MISIFVMNQELARDKGLSEDTCKKIEKLYGRLSQVLSEPWCYCETGEDAVRLVNNIESNLQELWGFPYNPNWWYYDLMFYDCSCPDLDNRERRGTPYRISTEDCPYHGKNCKNKLRK